MTNTSPTILTNAHYRSEESPSFQEGDLQNRSFWQRHRVKILTASLVIVLVLIAIAIIGISVGAGCLFLVELELNSSTYLETVISILKKEDAILSSLFALTCAFTPSEQLLGMSKLKKGILYEGSNRLDYLKSKLKSTQSFRETFRGSQEEERQLDAWIALLTKAVEYDTMSNIFSGNKKRKLSDDINRLKPYSENTPINQSQLLIPGGTKKHSVMYEIKKNNDKLFSFIIYNKGAGADFSSFHVQGYSQKGPKPHTYHTRVVIDNLTETQVTDPGFLNTLIRSNVLSYNMTGVYQKIQTRLNIQGLNDVQTTNQPLVRNPKLEDFHLIILHGTCVVSNAQTPSHFVLSKKLRDQLKYHEIKYHLKQFGEERLKESHPALAERVQLKLQSLSARLSESSLAVIPK